ncbi:hypothetical protein BC332_00686 [Capsicum chinense]|nr:hypothetical protein BC332_00686 [Capsicum chinense]
MIGKAPPRLSPCSHPGELINEASRAYRPSSLLQCIVVNPQFITFANVTMESDKYICVRETDPQNSVVIIDMNMPMQPLRRPITADSVLMNPNSRILALKVDEIVCWRAGVDTLQSTTRRSSSKEGVHQECY